MTIAADAELLAAARNPIAFWLESCFGPGTLWRPKLPERLKSRVAGAFLTEFGIPAIEIDFVGYDAAHLPERGLWEADTDGLFAHGPDDFPPSNCSYGVAALHQHDLMVDGDTGYVEACSPGGRGYSGLLSTSLPQVIRLLALLTRFEERNVGGDARAALDEFTVAGTTGQSLAESDLWAGLLEFPREGYEGREED